MGVKSGNSRRTKSLFAMTGNNQILSKSDKSRIRNTNIEKYRGEKKIKKVTNDYLQKIELKDGKIYGVDSFYYMHYSTIFYLW